MENSIYIRQIALPFQGQYFGGTGSWSVVMKDLEGGAGSIGATMAHGYWVGDAMTRGEREVTMENKCRD